MSSLRWPARRRARRSSCPIGSSMSWSRRGILAALAAAPLAGCGFRPLYGGHAAGEYDPRLATIKVTPIADRNGQILELALREKLNPRGVALPTRYTLSVTLTLGR